MGHNTTLLDSVIIGIIIAETKQPTSNTQIGFKLDRSNFKVTLTLSIQTQVPIVKVEPKLDPTLEKWTLSWVKVLKSGIPNPPPPRGPPIPLNFYYFTMYSFVASLKNGSGDMGCIIFNAVASCCLHLKIEKARTKV